MNVYQLVATYRIKLLQRDTGAQRELQVAYDQAFEAINDELTNTARQMEASGPGASPALLVRDRRLRDLRDQVSDAMAELGNRAGKIATREQRIAVTAARDEAVQLIETKAARAGAQVVGVFNRLQSDVIAELVGLSAKETPVNIVFEGIARDLGLQTGARITRALVQGVTLGWHPDRIARHVRREADAKGTNPARSPVVVRRLHSAVRNEMFRAYRETTRATYQENDDVVKRWRWVSRQSSSTCVICWSQDGRTFPLSTPFASHPNCRCVQTPVLEGEREKYVTGPERFELLEEGVQREILGDSAFEAFASGELEEIGGLVKVVQSDKWGPSRARRSLDDALKQPQPTTIAVQPRVAPAAKAPLTFESDTAAAGWGKEKWSNAPVTDTQAEALRRYQSAGYQNVNPLLRGQKNFSGDRAEQYKEMIRQVDTALKHQSVPEDVIVFRAVGADALGGELSEKLTGRVFEEKAFMSTALASKVPREFKNKQVVLRLQVPKGTPGYYMPLVATDARMRAERELLLGRGLKYKLTSVHYNARSGKWEIDAQVINRSK